MPGPPPKHPNMRQRRNGKKSGRTLAGASGLVAPALEQRPCFACVEREADARRIAIERAEAAAIAKATPKKRGRPKKIKVPPPLITSRKNCKTCDGTGILPWHPNTIRAWQQLWAAPQAKEYILGVDTQILFLWVTVLDRIKWSGACPDKEDSKEFRLLSTSMGLTIMSRRTLNWAKAEDPADAGPQPELEDDDAPDAPDPRNILRPGFGAAGA